MADAFRINATGGVPEPLLRRTLYTRVQSRLMAVLVAAVTVPCLLPVCAVLFSLESTLYRYGTLFFAVAAVLEAAGVGLLAAIVCRRRGDIAKALARDAGDTCRTAEIEADGIAVTGPCGTSRVAFSDITRVYETREGLLLYCLSLHLWLPSAHLTETQCKALLCAVYAGLPATTERCVLADMQGGRQTMAAVGVPPEQDVTVLTAPYADAMEASGKDLRVLRISALGGLFIGSAAAAFVFPKDPLLPGAVCAVAGLVLLYALFGGIERVNAASLRRKDAKKQVHAACTAVLSETGCAVYADGVPLLAAVPLCEVTLKREDGQMKLTVGSEALLFPETEILQHLLERMNISHD